MVLPSVSSLMSMLEPFFQGRRVLTGAIGSSFTPPFRGVLGERADGGELLPWKIEIEAHPLGHDLEDANLHHVARLGALHVDRSGDRVRPSAGIGLAQLD